MTFLAWFLKTETLVMENYCPHILFIILHKSYMKLYSGKRAGQGMFPDNQSLIEAGLATRLNNLASQTPNNC